MSMFSRSGKLRKSRSILYSTTFMIFIHWIYWKKVNLKPLTQNHLNTNLVSPSVISWTSNHSIRVRWRMEPSLPKTFMFTFITSRISAKYGKRNIKLLLEKYHESRTDAVPWDNPKGVSSLGLKYLALTIALFLVSRLPVSIRQLICNLSALFTTPVIEFWSSVAIRISALWYLRIHLCFFVFLSIYLYIFVCVCVFSFSFLFFFFL